MAQVELPGSAQTPSSTSAERGVDGRWPSGSREDGQTMAEYGLILAGVFVLVAATVLAFGPALSGLFEQVIAEF
ncbi:MAG: Flp family type IVb pilin [Dehalococcoidia bacterium]